MTIGDQVGVNCGLDVLPECIRGVSTTPHCESAAGKHRNLQYFQTVNHSKIIWDHGAKPKGILGAHLNGRSMLSKHEQLEKLLMDSNLDFLCLSETWLTKTFPSASLAMPGYKYFRQDRNNGRGGGLLIYDNDHFIIKQVNLECSNDLEWIAVLITLSSQISFTIVAVYRPPSSDISFYDHFRKLFKEIEISKECILFFLLVLTCIFVIGVCVYIFDLYYLYLRSTVSV